MMPLAGPLIRAGIAVGADYGKKQLMKQIAKVGAKRLGGGALGVAAATAGGVLLEGGLKRARQSDFNFGIISLNR